MNIPETLLKYQHYVSKLSKHHLDIFSSVFTEDDILKQQHKTWTLQISLHEQDICGSCAALSVCRKFPLLQVKQNSKPTKRHSLGGILVDLLNKDFTDFTASRLDILLMLGNMLTMSKLKYYLYLNLYKQICTIKIVNTIKQMV